MRKILSFLLCFFILFSLCFSASAAYTEDGKVKKIAPGTTVSELKNLLAAVESVSLNNAVLADTENVGTGYDIVCNNVHYKAVVTGDVDGDGKISSIDYLMIKRYFVGLYTLYDEFAIAADTDEDGEISPYDYLAVKRHFIGTYHIGSDENAASIPILLYHHILPDADKATGQWVNNNITISVTEFTHHMQLIKDAGYTVVSIDEVVGYVKGERTLPLKSVVLCFDDGYKSNTEYAAPILRKFGYTATIFAMTQPYTYPYEPVYHADQLQHVTEKDLSMNSDVFTQQCHTFNNHNHLTEQTYSQIVKDLMSSQYVSYYKYFAYPYGDYNDTVIQAVKDAGLEAAFTTVTKDVVVGDNLYEIPRYTIEVPMADAKYLEILHP